MGKMCMVAEDFLKLKDKLHNVCLFRIRGENKQFKVFLHIVRLFAGRQKYLQMQSIFC